MYELNKFKLKNKLKHHLKNINNLSVTYCYLLSLLKFDLFSYILNVVYRRRYHENIFNQFLAEENILLT